MTDRAPIEASWDGEVFRPTNSYQARRADKQFARGEVLRLVDEPERSSASHNHYMVSVENAWESLPPLLSERWPSPKHLRSYALVRTGYCYSDNIVCPSHADAMRVASFARAGDEYALVEVTKNIVTRYRPKSQSYKSMEKEEFQESKEAVLRFIGDLLEVSKQELSLAGQAA